MYVFTGTLFNEREGSIANYMKARMIIFRNKFFNSYYVIPFSNNELECNLGNMFRAVASSIIGGLIFIYSRSAQLISFEIDCFYGV